MLEFILIFEKLKLIVFMQLKISSNLSQFKFTIYNVLKKRIIFLKHFLKVITK